MAVVETVEVRNILGLKRYTRGLVLRITSKPVICTDVNRRDLLLPCDHGLLPSRLLRRKRETRAEKGRVEIQHEPKNRTAWVASGGKIV
jgi:hypothetical protein